jgi:hypothetical protein
MEIPLYLTLFTVPGFSRIFFDNLLQNNYSFGVKTLCAKGNVHCFKSKEIR